jgi:hypothetical protein
MASSTASIQTSSGFSDRTCFPAFAACAAVQAGGRTERHGVDIVARKQLFQRPARHAAVLRRELLRPIPAGIGGRDKLCQAFLLQRPQGLPMRPRDYAAAHDPNT